ncbi:MAG: CoA transferase [Desulfobacteraceae bacterium]|nr:CoA transferase [Desulfobacteraceae bacterium]
MDCHILEKIRIIEISDFFAGPAAAMLLGQMGAQVIKIENRDNLGLRTIAMGNAVEGYDPDADGFDQSAPFNFVNNNKLSASLNIKTPEGVKLLKSLIKEGDVLIHNLRPGVLDKVGLGYDTLEKINPALIMLGASGFGASGPYREYGGYAWNFACHGGLAHLTGYPDMPPNNLTTGTDIWNGYAGAMAVLIALNHRQKTGKGQFIDLAQSETVSFLAGEALMAYSLNRKVEKRAGNRESGFAPNNCYPCRGKDQWVSISVAENSEWQALCKCMDRRDLAADKRFADKAPRWENQTELDKEIETWTSRYTKYEIMEILQAEGVAAMPSLSNIDLLANPHLKARNLFQKLNYSGTSQIAITPPFRFSQDEIKVSKAPKFGEHNDYVFKELLGISDEKIQKLKDEKVIY